MSDRELEIEAKKLEYAEDLELAKGNDELTKELERQLQADLKAMKDGYRADDVAAAKAADDAKVASAKAAADKEAAQRKAVINGAIAAASSLLDAIIANTEEGSKAQENALVAQAVMQGAQGAVSAFSQAMTLGPIAGPIVGAALVAGVAGMTVANISKIKGAKSGGGGSGPSPAPAISTAAPDIRETPSVDLFGGGNDGSGGDSSQFGNQEQNEPQQIQAVVSWSDIDAVQNNDNNIQQEMQL